MREQALTYVQIARQTGYSARTIAQYARQVLPAELRKKQSKGNGHQPATSYLELLRCHRCRLAWSPENPVDFASRLCLWCILELAGIQLHKAYVTGLYHAILQQLRAKETA
ncbi:MAG TPA: hypothetical protein VMX14_13295 [Anaerolineae bacterium]|nr:hypothetical protein [Anaerolineae bacterium]